MKKRRLRQRLTAAVVLLVAVSVILANFTVFADESESGGSEGSSSSDSGSGGGGGSDSDSGSDGDSGSASSGGSDSGSGGGSDSDGNGSGPDGDGGSDSDGNGPDGDGGSDSDGNGPDGDGDPDGNDPDGTGGSGSTGGSGGGSGNGAEEEEGNGDEAGGPDTETPGEGEETEGEGEETSQGSGESEEDTYTVTFSADTGYEVEVTLSDDTVLNSGDQVEKDTAIRIHATREDEDAAPFSIYIDEEEHEVSGDTKTMTHTVDGDVDIRVAESSTILHTITIVQPGDNLGVGGGIGGGGIGIGGGGPIVIEFERPDGDIDLGNLFQPDGTPDTDEGQEPPEGDDGDTQDTEATIDEPEPQPEPDLPEQQPEEPAVRPGAGTVVMPYFVSVDDEVDPDALMEEFSLNQTAGDEGGAYVVVPTTDPDTGLPTVGLVPVEVENADAVGTINLDDLQLPEMGMPGMGRPAVEEDIPDYSDDEESDDEDDEIFDPGYLIEVFYEDEEGNTVEVKDGDKVPDGTEITVRSSVEEGSEYPPIFININGDLIQPDDYDPMNWDWTENPYYEYEITYTVEEDLTITGGSAIMPTANYSVSGNIAITTLAGYATGGHNAYYAVSQAGGNATSYTIPAAGYIYYLTGSTIDQTQMSNITTMMGSSRNYLQHTNTNTNPSTVTTRAYARTSVVFQNSITFTGVTTLPTYSFANNVTVTVGSGSSITVNNNTVDVIVKNGGTFTGGSVKNLTVESGGRVSGATNVAGTFESAGTIDGACTVAANNTITITGGDVNANVTTTGSGAVDISNATISATVSTGSGNTAIKSGTIANSGVVNSGTGEITITGGTVQNGGTVRTANTGTNAITISNMTIDSGGTVYANGAGTNTRVNFVAGSGATKVDGTLYCTGTGTAALYVNGGTVSGTGRVYAVTGTAGITIASGTWSNTYSTGSTAYVKNSAATPNVGAASNTTYNAHALAVTNSGTISGTLQIYHDATPTTSAVTTKSGVGTLTVSGRVYTTNGGVSFTAGTTNITKAGAMTTNQPIAISANVNVGSDGWENATGWLATSYGDTSTQAVTVSAGTVGGSGQLRTTASNGHITVNGTGQINTSNRYDNYSTGGTPSGGGRPPVSDPHRTGTSVGGTLTINNTLVGTVGVGTSASIECQALTWSSGSISGLVLIRSATGTTNIAPAAGSTLTKGTQATHVGRIISLSAVNTGDTATGVALNVTGGTINGGLETFTGGIRISQTTGTGVTMADAILVANGAGNIYINSHNGVISDIFSNSGSVALAGGSGVARLTKLSQGGNTTGAIDGGGATTRIVITNSTLGTLYARGHDVQVNNANAAVGVIYGGGNGGNSGGTLEVWNYAYGAQTVDNTHYTSIRLINGRVGTIYGGGYQNSTGGSLISIEGGTINTTTFTAGGSSWTGGTVYGGGHGTSTAAPIGAFGTKITITAGTVHTVYGGGHSNSAGATVTGGTSLTISTGSPTVTYIYGGGYAEGGGSANILTGGNTNIAISGTPSIQNGTIYGGGRADAGTATVADHATIELTSGTFTGTDVHAGGLVGTSTGTAHTGTTANTHYATINIKGNVSVNNLYGGGRNGGDTTPASSRNTTRTSRVIVDDNMTLTIAASAGNNNGLFLGGYNANVEVGILTLAGAANPQTISFTNATGLHGGGTGDDAYTGSSFITIGGAASTGVVTGPSAASRNIYSGGSDGATNQSAYVRMNNRGSVTGDIYGGGRNANTTVTGGTGYTLPTAGTALATPTAPTATNFGSFTEINGVNITVGGNVYGGGSVGSGNTVALALIKIVGSGADTTIAGTTGVMGGGTDSTTVTRAYMTVEQDILNKGVNSAQAYYGGGAGTSTLPSVVDTSTVDMILGTNTTLHNTYGGGLAGHVGSTTVRLTSGTFGVVANAGTSNVYGGGNATGAVHTAAVNVVGGTYNPGNPIHGGSGLLGNGGIASYTGGPSGNATATVTVTHTGIVNTNIYGGGAYAGGTAPLGATPTATVNIHNTTGTTGNIFGGSRGGNSPTGTTTAGTTVNVGGTLGGRVTFTPAAGYTTPVYPGVYGGSDNGGPVTNSFVNVHNNGTVTDGNVYGGALGGGTVGGGGASNSTASAVTTSKVVVNGAVVGDANAANMTPNVQYDTATPPAKISGTTAGHVFGGGRESRATVQTSNVTVQGTGSNVRGNVYGGGLNSQIAGTSPSTTVLIGGAAATAQIDGHVFGGGYAHTVSTTDARVNGTTHVTISTNSQVGLPTTINTTTRNVYGGGQGAGNASVTTSSLVDIAGGTVTHHVYGGGLNNTVQTTTVNVATGTVGTVVGTASTGNVYGGGVTDSTFAAATSQEAGIIAGTIVNVTGGTIRNSVYGGGSTASASDANTVNKAGVGTTTNVYVSGNTATITKDVFGGGELQPVTGAANVTIGQNSGGTASASANRIGGNIYGGGENAADIKTPAFSADVNNTVVRELNGSVVKGVYGGGYGHNTLVKNGTSVTIDASTVGANTTLGHADNRNVYGGGASANSLTGNPASTANFVSDAKVEGGTVVRVQNGSTVYGHVYGGGDNTKGGYYTQNPVANTQPGRGNAGSSANVDGTAQVTVSGASRVYGDVYGGGDYRQAGGNATGSANVTGATQVSITGTGTTVNGDVFGGGDALGQPGVATTHGNANILGTPGTTTVTVDQGARINQNVYGGGVHGDVLNKATVHIGTTSGGATVDGNVYGGGANGTIRNVGTEVNVLNNSTVTGAQASNGHRYESGGGNAVRATWGNGGIYGGGRDRDGDTSFSQNSNNNPTVDGDTKVNVTSSDVYFVYGGGSAQDVVNTTQDNANDVFVTGDTQVNVTGTSAARTTVRGSIYGGGHGTMVTPTLTPSATFYTHDRARVDGDATVNVGWLDFSGGVAGMYTHNQAGNQTQAVYGGGEGSTVQNSFVNVKNDVRYGDVLGGGRNGGGGTNGSYNYHNVRTNANVTIENDGLVLGNVFGGGRNGAMVGGNTTTKVEDGGQVQVQSWTGGAGSRTNATGGSVYGGGDASLNSAANGYEPADVKGDSTVQILGQVDADVYGGGYSSPIHGNVKVDIESTGVVGESTANISYPSHRRYGGHVFGGGTAGGGFPANTMNPYGYRTPAFNTRDAGDVYGNVTLTVTGGTVWGNIYGGGEDYDVRGNVTVTAQGNGAVRGTVKGDIYGGGSGWVNNTVGNVNGAEVYGNVDVIVASTADVTHGDVYGGGRDQAHVLTIGGTDVTVTISGEIDRGNVYGGGYESNVEGDVQVNITDSGRVKGGYSGDISGAAYLVDLGVRENDTVSYANPAAPMARNHFSGGSVYGGSFQRDVGVPGITTRGQYYVDGDVVVNVYGNTGAPHGMVQNHVHGGGWRSEVKGNGSAVQGTLVNVYQNAFVGGNVYGAGRENGDVTGANGTEVKLYHTAMVGDDNWGEYYKDDNTGNSNVPDNTGTNLERRGNVFGGGYEANVTGGTKGTKISILDGVNVYADVYGASYKGDVTNPGGTKIHVISRTGSHGLAKVWNNVYGGGYASNVTSTDGTYIEVIGDYARVNNDVIGGSTNGQRLGNPRHTGSFFNYDPSHSKNGVAINWNSSTAFYVTKTEIQMSDGSNVNWRVLGGGQGTGCGVGTGPFGGAGTTVINIKDRKTTVGWKEMVGGELNYSDYDFVVGGAPGNLIEYQTNNDDRYMVPGLIPMREPGSSADDPFTFFTRELDLITPGKTQADVDTTTWFDVRHTYNHYGEIYGGSEFGKVATSTDITISNLDQWAYARISGGNLGVRNDGIPRTIQMNNLGKGNKFLYHDDNLRKYTVIHTLQDFTRADANNCYLTIFYNLTTTDDNNSVDGFTLPMPSAFTSDYWVNSGVYHAWRPKDHIVVTVQPRVHMVNAANFRMGSGYTVDFKAGINNEDDPLRIPLLIDRLSVIHASNSKILAYPYNDITLGAVNNKFNFDQLPETLVPRELYDTYSPDVIGINFYIPPQEILPTPGGNTEGGGSKNPDGGAGTGTGVGGGSGTGAGSGATPGRRGGGGGGGGGGTGSGYVSGVTGAAGAANPMAGVELKAEDLTRRTAESVRQTGSGGTGYVYETGADRVSGQTLRAMSQAASQAGGKAFLVMDTMNGTQIEGRMYIDPALASNLQTSILTRVYTRESYTATILRKFQNYYANRMVLIHMEHKGSLGMEVQIAAKVDLTGMNTANLHFYVYDSTTNTFQQIISPRYSVDSNGYLRFYTSVGGDVIVSNGPLQRK